MNAVMDQTEEANKQIDVLLKRKAKVTKMFINIIYVKQYPSESVLAEKTCNEYIGLVRGALNELQTGNPSVQEIVDAKVEACSPQQMNDLDTLTEDAETLIEDLHEQLKNTKETLEVLQLHYSVLCPLCETTTTITTIETTTTTTTTTAIAPSASNKFPPWSAVPNYEFPAGSLLKSQCTASTASGRSNYISKLRFVFCPLNILFY